LGDVSSEDAWGERFDRFVTPFLEAWRFKKRKQWAPLYLRGLLLPGERKSIEPIAARVAPGHEQELRHFVSESEWDDEAIEEVLWDRVDAMGGGEGLFLIIDDTALPKKGSDSVGVSHQYCGALGKQANCQSLVSLTLAKSDVPVPVALKLYLPDDWASDSKRRAKVGVPAGIAFREKWRIALDEVKRVRRAGVRFGTVLADAGYGACSEFRSGLSGLGYTWAVGVLSNQHVYPTHATTRMPSPSPRGGRPRRRAVASHVARDVGEVIDALEKAAFRLVTWRKGSKGPLRGRFAACRVRLADGDKGGDGARLPGSEVWLVCEQRANERKYYVTNHAIDTKLRDLAAAIKARWSCEQAHQQLKEELGLDHFEGRSWRGLHHHALLTMISFAFLQHERLRENKSAA
jgi:SRSO17 transposase